MIRWSSESRLNNFFFFFIDTKNFLEYKFSFEWKAIINQDSSLKMPSTDFAKSQKFTRAIFRSATQRHLTTTTFFPKSQNASRKAQHMRKITCLASWTSIDQQKILWKQIRVMSDYISEEVVVQILLRLPSKSLIEFKLIRKLWYSLVTTQISFLNAPCLSSRKPTVLSFFFFKEYL